MLHGQEYSLPDNTYHAVYLEDFLDAGIRCCMSANQTYAQVLRLGFNVSMLDFYTAWNARRALWKGRRVA